MNNYCPFRQSFSIMKKGRPFERQRSTETQAVKLDSNQSNSNQTEHAEHDVFKSSASTTAINDGDNNNTPQHNSYNVIRSSSIEELLPAATLCSSKLPWLQLHHINHLASHQVTAASIMPLQTTTRCLKRRRYQQSRRKQQPATASVTAALLWSQGTIAQASISSSQNG